MFLCDINDASFSTEDGDKKKKKGIFGAVVGRTIPGMLTRAAAVGTIGASLYGGNKLNNYIKKQNPYHLQYRVKQNINKLKPISAIAGGTATAGLVANEARKNHEKRNRKWYEIL